MSKFGRHPVMIATFSIVAILVIALALFDWDWLRPPLERYVSQKTQRDFRASHLGVKLGWNPTVRLDNVYFSNASWAHDEAMAKLGGLEFNISLRDLLERKILIPRLALSDAQISLEELRDGRKNWLFSDPSDKSSTSFRISSLSVTRGGLHFRDEQTTFEINVAADTFAADAKASAGSADRAAQNADYKTQFKFNGKYQGAGFDGYAQTGDVLSFMESGIFFPIRGELNASTTHLKIEGTIADAATLSGIDVHLEMQGQTLASLYPFLVLPLPATPPYRVQGRLRFANGRYQIEGLDGQIGSTDIRGDGTYTQRKPRPLLDVNLNSRQLVVSDLGPLIGVETKDAPGKPRPDQAKTATRPAAQADERAKNGDRILPAGKFDNEKLKVIDANFRLRAQTLKLTPALPLEGLDAKMVLADGLLKLEPVEFGVAGGHVSSSVELDARGKALKSNLRVELKGMQIDKLSPNAQTISKGAGSVGAKVELRGEGNSVADAAADANGIVAATVAHGRVSNILDAASGLNGGKVLTLFAAGDKEIAVNCGAVVFDVKHGLGTASLFRIDTDQTEITGEGGFNLANENFDVKIAPLPKNPSLLSLRTPVHVLGTFRNPDFSIEKEPLLLRAGGAVALAAVAPVAALLAFVETGPGENTDCAKVLTASAASTAAAAGSPASSNHKVAGAKH